MAKNAASKQPASRRPQLRVVDNAAPTPADPPRRKLIAFDPETFAALDLYRRDSMKDWEELAEEAFRDLLDKHGRSADLRTALKRSAKDADVKDADGSDFTSKKTGRSKRV
jgi:hypothetical protein